VSDYAAAVAAHDAARIRRRAITSDPRSTREQCAAAVFEWAAACEAFEAAYDRAVAAGEALRSDHADRPASPHHR
jgi:hypothetical protein